MTNFSDLSLSNGEHGFIAGKTGSGKTVLAKYLCSLENEVIIHDTKGFINWSGYERLTNLKSLVRSNATRRIYAPDAIKELDDEETIEAFFKYIYLRGNTFLYVDEVYSVCGRGWTPKYYKALLTRGREMGISVLQSSQRPRNIPVEIISESSRYYIFRLSIKDDRRILENVIGLETGDINVLKKYSFYYIDMDGDKLAGPYQIKI